MSGVLVVGDLMVDVVVVHDGPINPGSDTAARVRTFGGGSAANTAAWLATEGADTRLFAAVGHDDLGRAAVTGLTAGGVTFVGDVVEGPATGTCVVLVGPDGERTMLPDRGANDHLDPTGAVAALDPPPAWLHLSGYTLLGEGSRPAGLAVLAAARAAGVPVSVDASSAAPLSVVGADTFLGWVDGMEVLLANDDEAAALGGRAALLGAARSAVVKHGAAGATWTDGTATRRVSAVAAVLVDSTGAGDAFAAGWIAARTAGADPSAATEAGARSGARAVGRAGARP